MEIVTRNLSELKHVEGNTRLHSAKQIKEYIRSIEMFGQLRPMVIDENNVVLAGNGLLAAMRKMGTTQGACHVVKGLNANEKKKLMIADNRIAELGEENQFAFEEIIRELSGDVDIPGYGVDILKRMASDLKTIDAIGEENSVEKVRREKKKPTQIICPHCGFKFDKEVLKCREKQNAPADMQDARA